MLNEVFRIKLCLFISVIFIFSVNGEAQVSKNAKNAAAVKDWEDPVNSLAEKSCKQSEDCILIHLPCGGYDAFNKDAEEVVKLRLKDKSKHMSCGYVEPAFTRQKNNAKYAVKCTNNICSAEMLRK